jgi:hypothetical protein
LLRKDCDAPIDPETPVEIVDETDSKEVDQSLKLLVSKTNDVKGWRRSVCLQAHNVKTSGTSKISIGQSLPCIGDLLFKPSYDR